MTITLRIILMIISIVTFLYVMRRINKAKIQIADSIFWIFFSIILLIFGLFPNIINYLKLVFGISDPTNCLFFLIIGALLVKTFGLSIKVSQLENKLVELIQSYGIDHTDILEIDDSIDSDSKDGTC